MPSHPTTSARSRTSPRLPLRRSLARLLALALLALMALSAVGCTRLLPAPPLSRRVAVLDLAVPEDYAQRPTATRGWWLGKHTLLRNAKMGELFADDLGRSLTSLEYVEQHSRADVRFYMATKRKLLTDRFAGRTETDYAQMLAQVSPADYGEELGVDQILTGRVVEAYTSTGHILGVWRSTIRVEVNLWDMRAGRPVWSSVFSRTRRFTSDVVTAEELAGEVVQALDRYYCSQK